MFYNFLYILLLIAFSPLLLIALFYEKYRWNILNRLNFENIGIKSYLVFYGASIGEWKILLPLAMQYKNHNQVYFCQNKSCYDYLKINTKGATIRLMPLDFSFFMDRILKKAKLLVIAESEFWPNLLQSAHSYDVPIYYVNCRLNNTSYLLLKIFNITKKLSAVNSFYTNSISCQENLLKSSVAREKIKIVTSFKFEKTIKFQAQEIKKINNLSLNLKNFLFVCGSIQASELDFIIPVWREFAKKNSNANIVAVLRHLDQKDTALQIVKNNKLKLLSQLDNFYKFNNNFNLLARFGELKKWYSIASCAFVGGSLVNRGGQNFIQAVGYGVPTATGQKVKNFIFERDFLLNYKAITIINNQNDLLTFLNKSYNKDKILYAAAKKAALEINKSVMDYKKLTSEIIAKN